MKSFELWVAAYLLNSLWQAPLILAAAWLAARMIRRLGPRTEHRVWVCALIAQAVLPLCDFRASSFWEAIRSGMGRIWLSIAANGAGHSGVRVVMGPGLVLEKGALQLPGALLGLAAAIYGCCLLFIALRLLWGLWKTRLLRRTAEYLTPWSEAGHKINLRGYRYGIEAMQVAIACEITGPMTVGIRQPVLLLPPDFLESVSDQELDAVLSHESAHMQRRDFAKNLLYRLISLPVAYHPATWRTMSHLAESREMVCDAIAAESVAGREIYARALLRLASMLSDRPAAIPLHAIGIFDANIFERRVMRLTGKQNDIRGVRRLAIVAACSALGIGTCASAVTLSLHVDAAARASEGAAQTSRPKKVKVSAAVMAGNVLTKVNPTYPQEAKSAKIQGTVVLHATIGTDGKIKELQATSGPKELQQSALDAVWQWTYTPYLLNGEPIEVETQVNVIYSLEK